MQQGSIQIAGEIQAGFETTVLKPPPIELFPFEKAVDAYSQMAARKGESEAGAKFRLMGRKRNFR